jgi:hypothetical protein
MIVEADDLSTGLRDAAAILETRLRERDEAQREADASRAALLAREQTARRAAETLSRAKDEFVATVSHGRTLNAIVGWVARCGPARPPAQQAHALGVIERTRARRRSSSKISLDMSRVIQGQVRLELRSSRSRRRARRRPRIREADRGGAADCLVDPRRAGTVFVSGDQRRCSRSSGTSCRTR